MANLYVFGIGGTGARVLKSLTMLLSTGVQLNNFNLVPILIDTDLTNGDLTRTIDMMNSYKKIHDQLSFTESSNNQFFRTKIGVKPANIQEDFHLILQNTQNDSFEDFLGIEGMSQANKALMHMLFSQKNRKSDMIKGFKGNPNIGSVALNQFESNPVFKSFGSSLKDGDRIFIISSIYGGTGAAGFPLLLKILKSDILKNKEHIKNAPIAALTVTPYFTVEQDPASEIDGATFMAKTRAAMYYYNKNVDSSLNHMYYIGDKNIAKFSNHEGSKAQTNPAHLVELASALSIVDFANTPKENLQNQNGKPINPTTYKRFGFKANASTGQVDLNFKSFYEKTLSKFQKRLIQFKFFDRFMNEHINDNLHMPWAESIQVDESFLNGKFYDINLKNIRKHFNDWLNELAKENNPAYTQGNYFIPFKNTSPKQIFDMVDGNVPTKGFFFGIFDEKGFKAFDKVANEISKSNVMPGNPEESFMELFYNTTEQLVEEKFKNI